MKGKLELFAKKLCLKRMLLKNVLKQEWMEAILMTRASAEKLWSLKEESLKEETEDLEDLVLGGQIAEAYKILRRDWLVMMALRREPRISTRDLWRRKSKKDNVQ